MSLQLPYPKATDAKQAVANGIAWLDEYVPAWWDEIDVMTLDLSDTCHCVLGQLGGGKFFDRADDEWGKVQISPFDIIATEEDEDRELRKFLKKTPLTKAPLVREPSLYGFDYLLAEDYEQLDRLWVQAIKARRKAYAA